MTDEDPGVAAYVWPPPIVGMGSACALFDVAGRVLLVRHTYGKLNWELPGGGAEQDESPDETAVRELREETGLDVELIRLAGTYFEPGPRPDHEHGPMIHFVFQARSVDDRTPVACPPEIGDIGWWSLDDLPTPISDFTEQRIRDAASGDAAVFRRFEPRTWRE